MTAKELVPAKLSLRQARRCTSPERTEHPPTTPAIKAKINMKLVDGFPPKSVKAYHRETLKRDTHVTREREREREREGIRGWFCSPLMYLSRDHPASPRTIRYATKLTTKRGPIRSLPRVPTAIVMLSVKHTDRQRQKGTGFMSN